MAKRGTTEKRPRRERGSLNPEEILEGAFTLAEQVSVDNLSMPLLGKHLGVGVTSIYWYFRKKDDLLNAMADRALRQYTFATPFIDSSDWRISLHNHARTMRKTFLSNPILCDLILIRSALSEKAARLGAQGTEVAVASLLEAGMSLEDAVDTYSAIQLHVRGCVVLQRLYDKNKELDTDASAYYDMTVAPDLTPLLTEASARGLRSGAPDDRNFEYGLNCILDHASTLIEPKKPAKKSTSTPTRGKSSAKNSAS